MIAKKKSKTSGSDQGLMVLGVSLMGLVVVIFGTLFFLLFNSDAEVLDEVTLCPLSGARSTTVVLLDRTDAFGAITRADIQSQIEQRISETEAGGEVILFGVNEVVDHTLEPIIRVCNPGSPQTADPLYSSFEIMKRNWDERFETPLKNELQFLMTVSSAETSPIMESAQSVSITHLHPFPGMRHRTKLIIVSDFLQNSSFVSFYGSSVDYAEFSSGQSALGLNPDLAGVEVELWLIQRASSIQGDGSAQLNFFASWISEHGGQLTRVLRLSGFN
jgi:hypothetical protein